MTSLVEFKATDLLHFNPVNLDVFTETYNIGYYLHYLARWPRYMLAARNTANELMSYVIAKSEGIGASWHGHITALTCGPTSRRIGLSSRLMAIVERIADTERCLYVDLFVRRSNTAAIGFYTKLQYKVYAVVNKYYAGAALPQFKLPILDGSAGSESAGNQLALRGIRVPNSCEDEDAFDMRKPLSADPEHNSLRPPESEQAETAESEDEFSLVY